MGKRLRVGVVGCGAIADRLHVPDLRVCPEAEIAALCDVDEQKAHALAQKYAPKARIYTDYRTMLDDGQVEGVIVALPNTLHLPVTVAAAEAGCHVMVEKPMAASADEAQQMIDAANKAGVLLMVNQCQRLFPAHRKAKEVLDSGLLGRVLYVAGMFGHGGPKEWCADADWFWHKDMARFGAMADLGIHKADLIRYLTGKDIVEVSAFTENEDNPGSDVEDNFAACLRFEDGSVGLLGASWTARGGGADYTYFHCEKGTLRVQVHPDKPCVANLDHPECEIDFEPPPPLNNYPGSWGLDAGGGFVRAALGLEEPFCTGEEGKRSLAVILAAEEAAKSGRTVKV